MSYYPLLIDLKDVPCLIAGGGEIALHKAEVLTKEGACVTVVSSSFCDGFSELPVTLVHRRVTEADAQGKTLVIDSTGDKSAEEMLSKYCGENHILYSCSGNGESCKVIFPAVLKKGRTIIAVSSQGASPLASVWLRDSLKEQIPDNMDDILGRMAQIRSFAKENIEKQKDRKVFLKRCLDLMLESGKIMTDDEIKEELTKIKGGSHE